MGRRGNGVETDEREMYGLRKLWKRSRLAKGYRISKEEKEEEKYFVGTMYFEITDDRSLQFPQIYNRFLVLIA